MTMPPRKENEDWKDYCFRQKAYISMLEDELINYRKLMINIIQLKTACSDAIRYHRMYVENGEDGQGLHDGDGTPSD